MRDVLRAIVAAKRAELRRRPPGTYAPSGDFASPVRDFAAALGRPDLAVVAEIKRRSPSAGPLRETLDAAEIARAYAASGAAALSVVTEPRFFGGSLADLASARKAGLPVLRKDFLLDPLEMPESRALGADAVLLVARILGPIQLSELVAAASACKLTTVVEVHREDELDRALASGAPVIGINGRDLETFAVDLANALRLRPLVPPDRIALAESGVRTPSDVRAVARAGFDALLVGEALLRARDPGRALSDLRGCAS